MHEGTIEGGDHIDVIAGKTVGSTQVVVCVGTGGILGNSELQLLQREIKFLLLQIELAGRECRALAGYKRKGDAPDQESGPQNKPPTHLRNRPGR